MSGTTRQVAVPFFYRTAMDRFERALDAEGKTVLENGRETARVVPVDIARVLMHSHVFGAFVTSHQYTSDIETVGLNSLQTLWADNSDNSASLSIFISGSGQTIVVPPYSQGYFRLLASPLMLDYTVSSLGSATIEIGWINVELITGTWAVAGPAVNPGEPYSYTPIAPAQYALPIVAATSLTVPAGALFATVQAQGATIYYTTSGATPSSVSGALELAAGSAVFLSGAGVLAQFKAISAAGTISVEYFE
jgi:hypothetical protein